MIKYSLIYFFKSFIHTHKEGQILVLHVIVEVFRGQGHARQRNELGFERRKRNEKIKRKNLTLKQIVNRILELPQGAAHIGKNQGKA